MKSGVGETGIMERQQHLTVMKSLLQVGVEFLSGSHSLQFTGLVLINKIIDAALALGNCCSIDSARDGDRNRKKRKKEGHRSRGRQPCWNDDDDDGGRDEQSETKGSKRPLTKGSNNNNNTRRPRAKTTTTNQRERSEGRGGEAGWLIDYLCERVQAGAVLSLVLNAITLHRRVVGTRFRCTPSVRTRHCTYHCLQILSGRLLLYVAQSSACRRQLMEEAPLRMMVEALDYTLDPQLLCLVIQTVALLALHRPYQAQLLASGIPDALTQLVLPSDEWYYTNHTTRFSRVVKHHAARALVYLGLARCLGPRVSLFDNDCCCTAQQGQSISLIVVFKRGTGSCFRLYSPSLSLLSS